MDGKKDPGVWAVTHGPFQQLDGELFESGMLADAEVKCARRTWKVHKIILCARSDWFKKALMGPFKEGRTGQVTITNFKPAEIDCLLKFIYTGTINLRKSYPRDNTWRALIKIWKMADFFCLDILCELVIAAAKDCSMQMARVFCAFNVPNGHDQYKISLFDTDFAPAVKAIYEDEEEIAKPHFAPIILGQAVVSIHKLSQMEEFEKLLRDVPSFAVDWATAFMKGLPQPTWSTMGLDDRCTYCERSLDVDGIVDTIQFMRGHDEVLCPQCYRLASLEVWKNHLRW